MSGFYPAGRAKRFGLVIGSAVTALMVLASIAITTAIATTASCANTATLTNSAFEIDVAANLTVSAVGCIDWLAGADGSAAAFRSDVIVKNDKATGATPGKLLRHGVGA